MKKQRTKTKCSRWCLFLIGGIVLLSARPIRSSHFYSANCCYAAEKTYAQTIQEQKRYLVDKTNEERMKNGLSHLAEDEKLSSAAMVRAEEQHRLFSHIRPDGSPFYSVFSQYGIGGTMRGENLARGLPEACERVFQGWLESCSHRDNILFGQFTKIGIGYAESNGIGCWCMLFTN